MKQVGENLENYDSDRKIPLFGFGAQLYGHKEKVDVSHNFALTGDCGKPEVVGSAGMLDCYQRVIPHIRLWGPTYFHEVLAQLNKQC